MPRLKERKKFIYKPSTVEVFNCLQRVPGWIRILLQQKPDKDYAGFLDQVIANTSLVESDKRITVKSISETFNLPPNKISKWICESYNDLIQLNLNSPELFTNNKIPVLFYMSRLDISASINIGLDVVPREYETVTIPFMTAKFGLDVFWVSKVQHEMYNEKMQICVWLKYGFANKYRDMVLQEGLFKGWIDLMDVWHKTEFEIDDILHEHLPGTDFRRKSRFYK
jgi:hypothetical protein